MMPQPTLAQPLGGWLKPADRVGHLLAFLHVHEIVNEPDELASRGRAVPVYRDIYIVDYVDFNEGGAQAVVQRRVKVGHPGIAGRLDVDNKSIVLGVIGQGERKSRDMDPPWILAGHTPEQAAWFAASWWPAYEAARGPAVSQPAVRVQGAPQMQQQQMQQPAWPQQQPAWPQMQPAPQWQQQGPGPVQQPAPVPASAPPQAVPHAWPDGAAPYHSGGAGLPPAPGQTNGTYPTPPQAVPHAWPDGAAPSPGAASYAQGNHLDSGGLPPAPGQTNGTYPAPPQAAAPPAVAAPYPTGMPPGMPDPATVDPATAQLMGQLFPGSAPVPG